MVPLVYTTRASSLSAMSVRIDVSMWSLLSDVLVRNFVVSKTGITDSLLKSSGISKGNERKTV